MQIAAGSSLPACDSAYGEDNLSSLFKKRLWYITASRNNRVRSAVRCGKASLRKVVEEREK